MFELSDGLSIKLATGVHPCKFPKAMLCTRFPFFKDKLASNNSKEVFVELVDVSQEIFDLVMQLAILKSFQLRKIESKTPKTELTAIIQLAQLAFCLGLADREEFLDIRVKELLVHGRSDLQASHIVEAYKLAKNHPICRTIVQSQAQFYFMHQNQLSMHGDENVYAKDEPNAGRRVASIAEERYRFQDQIDDIGEFGVELLREALQIWHNRCVGKP